MRREQSCTGHAGFFFDLDFDNTSKAVNCAVWSSGDTEEPGEVCCSLLQPGPSNQEGGLAPTGGDWRRLELQEGRIGVN